MLRHCSDGSSAAVRSTTALSAGASVRSTDVPGCLDDAGLDPGLEDDGFPALAALYISSSSSSSSSDASEGALAVEELPASQLLIKFCCAALTPDRGCRFLAVARGLLGTAEAARKLEALLAASPSAPAVLLAVSMLAELLESAAGAWRRAQASAAPVTAVDAAAGAALTGTARSFRRPRPAAERRIAAFLKLQNLTTC